MFEYKISKVKEDEELKELIYLPYIDGLNKIHVDKYNSFLLKKKFGYNQDEKDPKNYYFSENRHIKDIDRYYLYLDQKNQLVKLLKDLKLQFRMIFISMPKSEKKNYIKKQFSIVNINLKLEIDRLKKILNYFNTYYFQSKREKKLNFYHLIFVIILIITIIFSLIIRI